MLFRSGLPLVAGDDALHAALRVEHDGAEVVRDGAALAREREAEERSELGEHGLRRRRVEPAVGIGAAPYAEDDFHVRQT